MRTNSFRVYGTLYFLLQLRELILDCPKTVSGPSRNLPLNLPTLIRNSPTTIDIEQCHRTFVEKRGSIDLECSDLSYSKAK